MNEKDLSRSKYFHSLQSYRRPEPWMSVHIPKKVRKGKTPEELIEMRKNIIAVKQAMEGISMICPLREGDGPVPVFAPKGDTWIELGKYHVCSYCGSMMPEEVIQAVKELGPDIVDNTTKVYKRYIRLPGVSNASEGPIKFYVPHFSPEQIDAYNGTMKDLVLKKTQERAEKKEESDHA